MAKTSMNIRMDSEIKQQAKKLFAEFGLDMTTAVNMFLRQSIREHRIPFEIRLDTLNMETLAAIEESERLLKEPDTKKFSSIEELFEELNS